MLRTVIGFSALALISTTTFAGDGGSLHYFATPSRNVLCVYSDGEDLITCNRLKPSFISVTLTGEGEATTSTDQSDTIGAEDTHIIAYGKSWKESGYKCLSAKTGITCSHGKHGFSMSKKSVKVY
jgi:ABC-type Fe2+-enterobactin transport system substrate-binding protein